MFEVEGKKVIVVGLGRQGIAAARWLAHNGARVVVTDRGDTAYLDEQMAALEGVSVEYALGGHSLELLDDAGALCISGGVPLDIPFVAEARARDIPLTNDAQLFLERCPARVIGITGSAGKTTTTSLVGAMCQQTGVQTWVGGNIGHVLIGELDNIGADDHVVMEFSSFQLELVTTSPHIAAVLNITPNHLDRHGSMQAYIDAKARILQHQEPSDIAVLGRDNPAALGLARETKAGAVWLFSLGDRPQPGAYLEGDVLALAYPDAGPQAVCRRSAVKLRGAHNLLNVLAACAIAGAASVPVDAMRAAIESFEGVPHRLEPVARVKDVLWVNDSIATAPERVVAALRSFDEPLVLLAGGRDKDLPWQQFAAEAAGRVRHLICFGEAGAMIAQHVSFAWMRVGEESALEKVEVVEDLPAAVVRAAASARPGELVLLSPGGTSYDAYRDFEERGEHFRDLVRELAGE